MPSPTSTTVPTERVSAPVSNWSIADLMIVVMSSDLMAISYSVSVAIRCVLSGNEGAGLEAAAETFEPPAHAAVDQQIAEADLHAAEQRRVHVEGQVDAPAGHLFESAAEGRNFIVSKWRRTRRYRLVYPLALVVQAPKLTGDLVHHFQPAAAEHQTDQVVDL